MAEEKKWITLKSGKKVQLDENGNVIAGFQGFMGKNISELGEGTELKKYSPPQKSLSTYIEENNNPTKGAQQYFADNLKNSYVRTKIEEQEIDIHFTKNTAHKLRNNLYDQPELAYFVDVFPSVLENYLHSADNYKPRKDYDGFHYFQKTVTKNINGKKVTVKIKIDVGINQKDVETYEMYSTSKIK